MYISLYSDEMKHITNITNVTFELTQRVYDNDNFSADGVCDIDVNEATIMTLNDEYGNYQYGCFVDNITSETRKKTIKGLDFKSLLDTEILLDYTQPDSFDGRLSAIFKKVTDLIFNDPDVAIQKIKVKVNIPEDDTDTTDDYGSYQDTYQITNAYTFLKCYLKYYEYNIETKFDIETDTIIFTFVKNEEVIDIALKDFIYELTTTSASVNKSIATIKWESEEDEDGNPLEPRPSTLATRYYYLTKDNEIVQADEKGDIEGRIYPVKCEEYEGEYLADAQFDAVYALANARFVDNIEITENSMVDPIKLSDYALYTKFKLYYDGKLYKTLPISEKNTTLKSNGLITKVKLGFKKVLLTEIIKAD